MKKFNLVKEIIVIARDELLKAINTNKEFAINYKGEVVSPPYANNEICIFKGKAEAPKASALSMPKPQTIAQILGKNYKVVEDEDRVLVKAAGNWQELIGMNLPSAEYDDTTSDGVAEFGDQEMEDMGWTATDFDIDYRDMVEEIESKVDGVIFCIEQESPYQFSGMGIVFNIQEARDVLFNYCQNIIKEKLANDPDFTPDKLTDDEEAAAKFFKAL
ncbi:MAG: hypothetical protein PF439_03400 [Helicobacteraceae bacterium]|nr:hypothetical protein [Helicobacteraceae bacterium]